MDMGPLPLLYSVHNLIIVFVFELEFVFVFGHGACPSQIPRPTLRSGNQTRPVPLIHSVHNLKIVFVFGLEFVFGWTWGLSPLLFSVHNLIIVFVFILGFVSVFGHWTCPPLLITITLCKIAKYIFIEIKQKYLY